MPGAARKTDLVTAVDTHIVMVPSPGGPVPTPTPLPFSGPIQNQVSSDVSIERQWAATVGSEAVNQPSHIPPPSTTFQIPPTNKGVVQQGSATVLINGKPAARMGDPVLTCFDVPGPLGQITTAAATVLIG